MEQTVDEKINSVYTDQAGFGSLKDTAADVRKRYPEIKYSQVKDWYKRNVEFNVVQRGVNSYVANNTLEEFQADLFFMNVKPDDEYKIAVACVDVFTKYAVVVALKDKKPEGLLEGLKHIFKHMGGNPAVLMSDEEGSLHSKLVNDFLRKEGIKYIVNRNHTPFVERFIRTFRNMVFRRLQRRKEERWYNLIFEILLTYNRKMVNRMTGLTPVDATKPENFIKAKMSMENKAEHEKKYEEIKVGDRVKVFRQRKHLSEKENVLVWSRNTYEVVSVERDPVAGSRFYLAGKGEKPYLRGQILKA